MKNMKTFRITFTDCDDFASYVLDSLTALGYKVTEELNEFLGINLPIGEDLYKMKLLPKSGCNYEKFDTVRSWLYDLYENKFKNYLAID
ncbi:hypothetical protein HZP37_08520 [Elizabethkingia anophelis]|nr:hypothetical protein [Elizabethkingia anophelis]MCT4251132.1 hypothetical protein [Elizabethkingia anophelis]